VVILWQIIIHVKNLRRIAINMIKTSIMLSIAFLLTTILSCGLCKSNKSNTANEAKSIQTIDTQKIRTGADQISAYLPLLKGKKVGLMGNQTTIVGDNKEHLVDVLLANDVDLKFGFAPEHGF